MRYTTLTSLCVTLEGIVEQHEPFYLLEPWEERWGRWVLFKCTCEDFFGAGCCGHSTLLALLFDASLGFQVIAPPDSSRDVPGEPRSHQRGLRFMRRKMGHLWQSDGLHISWVLQT
jgi:hypothetical protein